MEFKNQVINLQHGDTMETQMKTDPLNYEVNITNPPTDSNEKLFNVINTEEKNEINYEDNRIIESNEENFNEEDSQNPISNTQGDKDDIAILEEMMKPKNPVRSK